MAINGNKNKPQDDSLRVTLKEVLKGALAPPIFYLAEVWEF
jgi:hypothetical protein